MQMGFTCEKASSHVHGFFLKTVRKLKGVDDDLPPSNLSSQIVALIVSVVVEPLAGTWIDAIP
jgi:hypothetical protein